MRSDKYIYHLSVCGGLQRGVCTDKDTGDDAVSSCQVDGSNHKIAGDQKKKKRSWFAVWLFLQLWLICACVCACACRDGEPASDLPGRSADLELHQRRDMSQDLPAVHRDPLLLPPWHAPCKLHALIATLRFIAFFTVLTTQMNYGIQDATAIVSLFFFFLLKGVPEFIKETTDCTYLFNWPTALACLPVKTTSCSYQ